MFLTDTNENHFCPLLGHSEFSGLFYCSVIKVVPAPLTRQRDISYHGLEMVSRPFFSFLTFFALRNFST